MKIADIRIEPSTLPKLDKDWKFALGGGPEAKGLILTIVAEDGAEGYGYGSRSPQYGATLGSGKATLERLRSRPISTARWAARATPRTRSTAPCTIFSRAASASRPASCSAGLR